MVSAALTLSGCGGSTSDGAKATVTVPVTFSTTTTTPTSTVPAPTSRAYIGPNGFPIETGPFLAASTTTRLGAIIRGIQCEPIAQLAYTTYAHLQVYVRGRSRALPGGIGMLGQEPAITPQGLFYGTNACMYWLHTRAADGLMEAQSPVPRRFTLGDFFAIWNQPLGTNRVAGTRGPVTATVNGKRWSGNPASIPLTRHATIQLAVGRPVPGPQPVDWVGTNF